MFEGMDSVIRPWENALKIPAGVTSRQYAPEAVAYFLEIPEDLLFDTFGAKVAKFLIGLILSLVPQQILPMIAPSWSSRDTEDMQGIAKHLLAEGLDPTPAEMVKIADAVGKIRQGITFGNWDSIAQAVGAKPISQVVAELNQVGAAITHAFGLPSAAPPTSQPPPQQPPATPAYPPATIESAGFG